MKNSLLFLIAFLPGVLFAQVANDSCSVAQVIVIPTSGSICVNGTTVGATSDNSTDACNTGTPGNEVWFTFIATGSDNTITVTPIGSPSIQKASIHIDGTGCGDAAYNTCGASATNNGTATATWTFTPGTQVWVSVESNNGVDGAFQMCITSQTPQPAPGNSCATATTICDKSDFSLTTFPNNNNGLQPSCFVASLQRPIFYKFSVGQTGTLEWMANPVGAAEYDWAIYDITSGCPGTEVFCNYNYEGGNGAAIGMSSSAAVCPNPNQNITGDPTLEICPPMTVTAGKTYLLVLDNYSDNSNGFNFSWGGTFKMAPTAQFVATPTFACDTANVAITNTSISATSSSWNFGDGNTFTGANPPNHIYHSPGNYLLSLAITSASGCTDVISKNITVGKRPLVNALPPTDTICAGESVLLTGTASVDTTPFLRTYDNIVPIPIPDNNTTGVSSVINISGLNASTVANNPIQSVCIDIDHPNDADMDIFLVCPNGTQMILSTDNGGTGDNYSHTCFSNSGTAVTAGAAPFTGNFTPEALLTSLNACNVNGNWTLLVKDDATGDVGTLLDWSITFKSSNVISSHVWSPNTNISSTTSYTPTVTPTTSTNYVLTVRDTLGCTNTDTVKITVNPKPNAGADQNVVCLLTDNATMAATGTGNWSALATNPGTATIASATSPTTSITSFSVVGTYKFVWTSAAGCTDTASVTVGNSCGCANPPTVSVSPKTGAICAGQTQLVSGTFGGSATQVTYSSSGTGTFSVASAGVSPFTVTYTPSSADNAAGIVTLYATTNNPLGSPCPVRKDSFLLTINPSPVATASNSGPYCAGASIALTGGGGATYSWSGPGGYTSATQNPVIASSTTIMSGTYAVTVTSSASCTATASTSVVVNALPAASASGGLPYCEGATIALTGGPTAIGNTYVWSGPNSYSNATQSPTIANATPAMSGAYTVTVTNAANCSASATANVVVNPTPVATATNSGPYCEGTTITFTGGASVVGNTYAWSGPNAFNNVTQSPTIVNATLAMGGVYSITVTNSSSCSATASTTVVVNVNPTATASNTGPYCEGANILLSGGAAGNTYGWSGPGSYTNTTQNPTLLSATLAMAGTYTITVTNAANCSATASSVVVINAAPAATASNSGPYCEGATIALTGGTNGLTTYNWSGPNSYANGTQSPTISGATPAMGGVYTVTVTNAAACSATASTTVEVNPLPVIVATPTNTICTANNGMVTVAVNSGGTPGYSYAWNPANVNNDTIQHLGMGTYNVTVTDSKSCSATATAIVGLTNNSVPIVLNHIINVKCNGQSNGAIDVTVGNGTYSYTYVWTPTSQTTEDATGLSAGTYSLVATDQNGCIDSAQYTVTEPVLLSLSPASQTNVSCNGGNNGSATLTVFGGSGAYHYLWNDPSAQTTPTATGLKAGNYTATVTDDSLCTATASFVITEPTAIVFASPIIVQPLCYRSADASITSSASGGTGSISYSWSHNSALNSTVASPLDTGSYFQIATDGSGCADTAFFQIHDPAQILFNTATVTDVKCFRAQDGTISSTAQGGTGTLTYGWNFNTALNLTNLAGLDTGTYVHYVTDGNGCKDSATYVIHEPTPVLFQAATITNVSCFGGNDGAITSVATGGTGVIQYRWSHNAMLNSATATGLTAGTYSQTATDANGCSITTSFTITEPSAVVFGIPQLVMVKCHGGSDGSIVSTASGGTGVISYSWSQDITLNSTTAFNLPAGTYTQTATDANGCSVTTSFTITEPTPIVFNTPIINDVKCHGENTGSIHSDASGGTGLIQYGWSHDLGLNSPDALNLVVGTYYQIATDANGCKDTSSNFTVNEPTQLELLANATPELCIGASNGTVASVANGGTLNYTYDLLLGTTVVQTNGNGNFNSLSPGTYTVSVTDGNGCTETQTVQVNSQEHDMFTVDTDSTSCFGQNYKDGAIRIESQTLLNGPYQYSIDSGKTYSYVSDFYNLSAGVYTIHARNNNGCDSSFLVYVEEPLPATLYITPNDTTIHIGQQIGLTIQLFPYPNSSITSYHWTPTAGLSCDDCPNPTMTSYQQVNEYVLEVTYSNDCKVSGRATIQVASDTSLYIPNAFSPNGDGNNDFFEVYGREIKTVKMEVFNRWGEKVYDSMGNPYASWDGKYKGMLQPPSVYVYGVEVEYLNSKKIFKSGSITLIR